FPPFASGASQNQPEPTEARRKDQERAGHSFRFPGTAKFALPRCCEPQEPVGCETGDSRPSTRGANLLPRKDRTPQMSCLAQGYGMRESPDSRVRIGGENLRARFPGTVSHFRSFCRACAWIHPKRGCQEPSASVCSTARARAV